MTSAAAAVIAAGAVVAALGIIWAATRRAVRGLVDVFTLIRQLLQLQPRVVELGGQLVALVDEMRGWRDHTDQRLSRVEAAVFPLPEPEGSPHVQDRP